MNKITKPTKMVRVNATAPLDHPLTWIGLACLMVAIVDSNQRR